MSFGKGILYEGGVRVPFIVQWPGVVPAGKVSDAVVSHLDIVPTCVAAAGGKLPADREYDGSDLRRYFAGKAGDWTDRPMFWRVWRDRAVRMGNWKLVWTGDAPPRLYDLATDIEEEHDLAAGHPADCRAAAGGVEGVEQEEHRALVPIQDEGRPLERTARSKPVPGLAFAFAYRRRRGSRTQGELEPVLRHELAADANRPAIGRRRASSTS